MSPPPCDDAAQQTCSLCSECSSSLGYVRAQGLDSAVIRRRAGGLRFLSLTSELGDLVATLTPQLLEALLAFQPPPRQPQRPRPRLRPARPPKPPLAERLPGLLARAPQQVGCRQFQCLQSPMH